MSEADAALLTVADAAARLGVTERRLRRLLARPEYAGRTGTLTRRTRTGTRTAAALSPDLIDDLSAQITEEENAAQNGDTDAAGKAAQPGEAREHLPANTAQASPLMSALLAEKDARIAELSASLEHEREQSRRLVEALTREQTLRAIEAPGFDTTAPAQNTPQEAPQGDSTGDRAESGHSQPADASQGKKRGFFARLFGQRNEAK